ncbi:MMPL family transporter [bacterium]|nr:MMPL family transporter [bacterium]
MTQFSVRHLSRFVSRHPNWCLLLAAIFSVASIIAIRSYLRIEMDLTALLPEKSKVAQITQSALRDFESFDFMFAVLEADGPGHEPELKAAAEELAVALEDRRFVRSVTYRITPETLEMGTLEGDARAIAVLTDEDWAVMERKLSPEEIERSMVRLRGLLNAPLPRRSREKLLQDPLNFTEVLRERIKIKSGPLKVNLRDSYFMSNDGEMLLMVIWPVRPATDLAFANKFQDFLEGSRRGIFLRNPEWARPDKPVGKNFRVRYFGSHYEAISDAQVIKGDLIRTSIASFAAVCLLFIVAFRRPEALVFVAIPLLLGVLWTLGLTSVLVGRLTQVTMAFSAILFGLGIDFSVHLYNRYLEEIRRGHPNREAIRHAVKETGPGIIAGALTTAIAFFGMMVTSFVGFRELGLVSGLGILCCLASVLLVLPALLLYFGQGPVGVFTQRPMSTLGLRRFYFMVMAYPRITVVGGLTICLFLGFQGRGVTFEDDFRMLKQPSDEYLDLRERIEQHFEVPSNQIVAIIEGSTIQEALEKNDQLFSNIYAAETLFPLVAKDSLRYFLPSAKTQQVQLERMARQDLPGIRARLDAIGADFQIAPAAFDPFMEQLARFQEAAQVALQKNSMPINLASLARQENRALGQIAQRYIYKSEQRVGEEGKERWRIATQIYPPEGEWVSSVPEAFIDSLGVGVEPPPQITGSAILQQELRTIIMGDLAIAVLVVIGAVFLYLLIYFESFVRALLAITPVLLGLLCMLGTIKLLNMHLHYLNIIAMPMVVGIGVDAGVHLLQRFYERNRRDLRATVTRTGRAVLITGMTTIFGFGSLALANFRGIRELGVFSIVGVGFTLLASLTILPALLRMTDPKVPYEGGPGDTIG